MSRCNTIIAAALAAAALAAPTALAQAPDIHAPLIKAAEANKQDLRSPDARDAARPETAGNPNVPTAAERALAQERYYMSQGKNAATDNNVTPAADVAPAEERNATPLTNATRTVATDTGDGIARLPFAIALLGALSVGLGAGSGLHLVHARRRHATRPVT
jgi:hypothetical protein